MHGVPWASGHNGEKMDQEIRDLHTRINDTEKEYREFNKATNERIDEVKQTAQRLDYEVKTHTESCPARRVNAEVAQHGSAINRIDFQVHDLERDSKTLQTSFEKIQNCLDGFKRDFNTFKTIDFESFKNMVKPQTDWVEERRKEGKAIKIALIIAAGSSLISMIFTFSIILFKVILGGGK